MDRRFFALTSAAAGAAAALHLPAQAQAGKPPEDGVEYISLDKPVDSGKGMTKGKLDVIEFFWYNCPHCNHFEPQLEKWIANLPKDVSLRRVPVAFRDDFVPQQRLFYALEAMGKLPTLHKEVFKSIHVNQEKLFTLAEITGWAGRFGLDTEKFVAAYNSFSVDSKVGKAKQLQLDFKVSGVPSLGILGRFYTDGAMAKDMATALRVADFLLAQSRKTKV